MVCRGKPASARILHVWRWCFQRCAGCPRSPELDAIIDHLPVHDRLKDLPPGEDPQLHFAHCIFQYEHAKTDKNTPYQFLADQDDCYFLTKNYFDGGGLNRSFVSSLDSSTAWKFWAFALGVSLEHNNESQMSDRMISGLNTNGSSIPITFSINGPNSGATNTAGYRPIVFADMTSTLMIYAGRVISVIN
jgi:hypothetical protein